MTGSGQPYFRKGDVKKVLVTDRSRIDARFVISEPSLMKVRYQFILNLVMDQFL